MLIAVSCACDEGPPAPPSEPPPPPRSPSEVPRPLDALEAEEPPPPSPWPEHVAPLDDSVERFEGLEACVSRLRSRMPLEVVDVIADVGYDQLLEDACKSLAAIDAGDIAACDALGVSAARRGCRRRLALVHGRPEACPEDAVAGGRDALCLAWASRSPRLCRGAPEGERARCEAVLANDAAQCAGALPSERARCRAEVARLGPSLADAERDESNAVEPSFRLTAAVIEANGDTRPEVVIERDVLERGVHLRADGCAWIVALERTGGDRPIPTALIDRDPIAAVQLRVPAHHELPLAISVGVTTAQIMVSLPGTGSSDSTAGAEGTVTLTRFAPTRGARIEARVDATLSLSPNRVRIEGTLVTFVRDVEPLPERCARE